MRTQQISHIEHEQKMHSFLSTNTEIGGVSARRGSSSHQCGESVLKLDQLVIFTSAAQVK